MRFFSLILLCLILSSCGQSGGQSSSPRTGQTEPIYADEFLIPGDYRLRCELMGDDDILDEVVLGANRDYSVLYHRHGSIWNSLNINGVTLYQSHNIPHPEGYFRSVKIVYQGKYEAHVFETLINPSTKYKRGSIRFAVYPVINGNIQFDHVSAQLHLYSLEDCQPL